MDATTGMAHADRVEQVRIRRESGLRDPMGWLTLVGLHWLAPGVTRFGSDSSNGIVLRAAEGAIPGIAGSISVEGDRVTVHPHPGGDLVVGSAPLAEPVELVDDAADDGPTILELGSLRLYLIRRGHGRLAIRVKDVASPLLRAFRGLDYFPVDTAWAVVGRLEPADPGATIRVPDVVGDLLDEETPGDVIIELEGTAHRLHALESMPGHLWLIFGDETNGAETYGGGRFLVTGPVRADNTVEVDFNLAYNPPCVFSPFATCPLPPDGNRLPIRVEAGERIWHAPDDRDGR